MGFKEYRWAPVYESRFQHTAGNKGTLVSDFYRPALSQAVQYDRLAGYLDLKSLASALQGIDSILETEGEIRLIASVQLDEQNKPVLTNDENPPLSTVEESRLSLIAHLMAENRLEVRIAEPSNDSSGIFHPKLGILTDPDGDRISFEGSINETFGAWYQNYERFKVHRSWRDAEARYVDADVDTFEQLWEDAHSDVKVYTLPEALEADLLDWQPKNEEELEEHVERVRESDERLPVPEAAALHLLSNYEDTVGALHTAEDVSSITPWPHQRVAADTAVSTYPESLLFCDEVGLGKTIEAGLSISRLVTLGKVENGLLIVPAAVQRQWQEELRERLNLDVFAYNLEGDHNLQDPYGNHHVLSQYDPNSGWTESHIGAFLEEREQPTIVLASWHLARMEQNKPIFSPAAHAERRIGDYTPSFEWDLTLVDEAHHARNGTNLYELLTALQSDSQCMYLLTATPMQLRIEELYDLLRMCDLPGEWADRKSFVEYFEVQRDLDEVREDVESGITIEEALPVFESKWGSEPYELRDRLETWVGMIRSYLQQYEPVSEDVADMIDQEVDGLRETRETKQVLGVHSIDRPNWERRFWDLNIEQLFTIRDVAETTTPVQSRIFRNTRSTLRMCEEVGLLDDTVPERNSELIQVDLGDARPAYDRIESYITDVYNQSKKLLDGQEQTAIGFVMTTYRERLTSSLYAAKRSLERRRENLRSRQLTDIDELDETTLSGTRSERNQTLLEQETEVDELGVSSSEGQEVLEYELNELESFIDALDDLPEDPKLNRLMKDLRSLSAKTRDRVIIFTQYEDTLDVIKNKMCQTYPEMGTYTGSGGGLYDKQEGEWKSASKERVKQKFRSGEISYLVCTDSASEGLNLQTCDALINYDLSWNPMTVEQRIGRIDRIGQKNETVLVWNYAYTDSIEEEIYDRAMERIGLFEQAVGPLRPILEGMEAQMEQAAMGASRTSSDDIVEDMEEDAEEAKKTSQQVGLVKTPESVTIEDIIESSKLDGWSQTHPDIGKIGMPERPFDPIISPGIVNHLFTQSHTLREQGWEFEMLERRELSGEYDEIPYKDIYRLNYPEDTNAPIPQASSEDTLQAVFKDNNSVVVTFEPDVLNEYPSVILLLPRNQLFQHLFGVIQNSVEMNNLEEYMRQMLGWLDSDNTIYLESAEHIDSPVVSISEFYTQQELDLIPGVKLVNEEEAKSRVRKWLSAYSNQ
jgi:SNF2 family DNA or RNA helicase